MEQKVKIGEKSSDLELVFVPYIPITTTLLYTSKNTSRMRKINKIFNLDIKDNWFPKKSISSRYSDVQISNPYKTIFIDNNMI